MIREIEYEELKEASDLLWKTFYETEKNNHSMAGMERFRDLVEPVSLSINTFDGAVQLFGYFEDQKLYAVGALKDKNHILMLYVLPLKQKSGIGKEMLLFLESKCETNSISLNSSDVAVSFYEHFGYSVCGKRNEKEGLISTPMQKKL